MTHPSDDDLVLHYYGEGDPSLDEHLAERPRCRGARAGIAEVLQAVTDPVPPLADEYGRAVWDRLQPSLAAARPTPPWVRGRARTAVAALALAASLAAAFLLGRASRAPEAPPVQVAVVPPVRERILLVAVGEHLERSRMVLVELENTPREAAIDISSERGRAQDLLSANRLYRQAAQRAGEPAVASVLEELERVLVEVAMSPDDMTAGALDEIQHRIEAQGIVFKLRVLGSQVQDRRRPLAAQRTGSQS